MRIINICAVVIAISMFTMSVEYVYGWSKVKPLAEDAWNTVYQWSGGLMSGKASAERVYAFGSLADQTPKTTENLPD